MEYENKDGLYQAVSDNQISEAIAKAPELNAIMFNDTYKGRKILSVEFVYTNHEVREKIKTKQAMFFKLEQL